MESVDALVDGGKASAGAPIGPALGPHGLNVGEVVAQINAKTKAFAGMKVPVKILIDPIKKTFEITVGTPPASALILKQLKVAKGSGQQRDVKAGDLTIQQLRTVSEQKETNLLGATVKMRCKEILGTCVSMGVTADGGQDPRDVQKAIDAGKYDEHLAE